MTMVIAPPGKKRDIAPTTCNYGYLISGWWFGTGILWLSIQLGMENHPNWLSLHHFSEGLVGRLKPPTRLLLTIINHKITIIIINHYKQFVLTTMVGGSTTNQFSIDLCRTPFFGEIFNDASRAFFLKRARCDFTSRTIPYPLVN